MARKPKKAAKPPATLKVVFRRRGWWNSNESRFYRRSDLPQEVPAEYRDILPSTAELVDEDFIPSESDEPPPNTLSEISKKEPDPLDEFVSKKGK